MPKADRHVWSDSATATRVRAEFFGEDGRAYSGLVDGYRPGFGHVIGFSYDKKIEGASGTWSLTVKRPESMSRRAFDRVWRDPENTWVKLTWMIDGQPIQACWGNVDSVNGNYDTAQAGARSATYTITGRDHGKIFEQTTMFVNMHEGGNSHGGIAAAVATWRAQKEAMRGPPDVIVRGLIETWLSNNYAVVQPWTLPTGLGGGPFADTLALRFDRMTEADDGVAFAANLLSSNQSGSGLWGTMTDWSNPVLNELFCDMVPDPGNPGQGNYIPGLYLRRRPFATQRDKRRWNALPKKRLARGDWSKMPLGLGGAAQRFNYWQLTLDQLAGADEGIAGTGVEGVDIGTPGSSLIFSESSIQRHGLRRYVANTKYLQALDQERARTLTDAIGRWLEILHDWFVVAPMQQSGTVVCTRVMPDIRVGEGLIVETDDGDQVFYVEGTSDQWTMGSGGTTKITVTRGEWADDDLLAYAYECAGYGRPLPAPPLTPETVALLTDEQVCQGLAGLVGVTGRILSQDEDGNNRFVEGGSTDMCQRTLVNERGALDITGGLSTDVVTEDAQIEGQGMGGLVSEGADVPESDALDSGPMNFEIDEEAEDLLDAQQDQQQADADAYAAERAERLAERTREQQAQQARMATYDPLTGIPTDEEHAAFVAEIWGD